MSIATRNGDLRRAHILQLIADYWESNGFGPSVRDIARQAGCAVSVASYHLGELEEAGLIARAPHTPRSLRVVKP